MPNPLYIAALGIAVMCLWGFYIIPGLLLVSMAVMMD